MRVLIAAEIGIFILSQTVNPNGELAGKIPFHLYFGYT